MSPVVRECSRLYRRVARAFPREFRMVCGDGLEQLGEDIIPLVWQLARRRRPDPPVWRSRRAIAVKSTLSKWIGKLKEDCDDW